MKQLKYILFILVVRSYFAVNAQYTSPFNGQSIQADSSGNYSFIVSGHFYGDGTNKSHFPANTLLANMDLFNQTDLKMLVCLGDLFKDISNDIPHYEKSFFNRLKIPLINTVGNHDLTGSVYQDNYGETAFMVEFGGDIHLILDTERDNGDIEDEQLDLLKQVLEKSEQGGVNHVFIYTHRTVWKEAYPEMEGLFLDNTQGLTRTNYESEVLPLLKSISAKSQVFWFSGSLGTAPSSFFYFHDETHQVKIIGTAIRALPRDAVLRVNVSQREVSFETISLTGEELLPLESYNVDFWQNEVGAEPFNWKLIPYYMELILTHRYFWYGVGSSLMAVLSIWFLRKRRRSRRT